MEINFKTDQDYLLASMLDTDAMYGLGRIARVALEERERIASQRGYTGLQQWDHSIDIGLETLQKAPDLERRLRDTNVFKQALIEAQQYQEQVEAEWIKNQRETSDIMRDISGLSFEGEQFMVYLAHKSYRTDRYLRARRILLGNYEEPRKAVIGIWHEILHDKLDEGAIAHALIQLAADNELRVRLNGGQYPRINDRYIKPNREPVLEFYGGHKDLFSIMERMLPDWMGYLTSQNRSILIFQAKMKEKLRITNS